MATLLLWYPHAPSGAPLRRVAGLSLARRAALAARKVGFAHVAVAVRPEDIDRVGEDLEGDAAVVAAPADLGALAAAAPGEDDVAVALGDRVWLHRVLARAAEPLAAGERARLVTGPGLGPALAVLRREDVGDIESEDLAESFDAAIGGLAGASREPVDGGYVVVDSGRAVPQAETLLLRSLVKEADGLVSRTINRRISLAITRRLARTDVRPNHVTLVVLAIGLLAAPLGVTGTHAGLALAGLCYYVSAIVDGVDGELSRLKYLGSPAGAWFDTVTDDVVGLAWLVGMYGGLARGAGWPWLAAGGAAIACYLASVVPRYYVLVTRVGAGDHQKLAAGTRAAPATVIARAAQAVKDTVFRTDFIPFYAFVTAALGVVQAFAVPYVAASVAAVVDTVKILRRTLPWPRVNAGGGSGA